MKRLPANLIKNRFRYTKVSRGKRTCMYEQHVTEGTSYFEVFMIKVMPSRIIFGKEIPEREIFPPDEAFGYWSWTYRTYEEALKKFKLLEQSS